MLGSWPEALTARTGFAAARYLGRFSCLRSAAYFAARRDPTLAGLDSRYGWPEAHSAWHQIV